MCRSSIPIETPPRVALKKPNSLRRSRNSTVAARPAVAVALEHELA
jgi:hypothetical protein